MADAIPTTPLIDCLRAQAARHREHATGLASAALLEEAADVIDRITTPAARDVILERRRQIEVEGWTADRDDVVHSVGQLAAAAACYAWFVSEGPLLRQYYSDFPRCPPNWPWDDKWFKPTDPRRDLIKAGALILAEIERIDRATERETGR